MKDMMMVPAEKWQALQSHYKNLATTNAALDKVGELGATEHLLLSDPNIPDSMAVRMIKPLSMQRRNLTKRLRTGDVAAAAASTDAEEPEAMVDTPSEALLKRLLKQVQTPKATPAKATLVRPTLAKRPKLEPQPGSSGLNKKPARKRKQSVAKQPAQKKKSGLRKALVTGGLKGLASAAGLKIPDDDAGNLDGSYLGPKAKKKGKGKAPKKSRQTELQKLALDEFQRGELDYSSDDDSQRPRQTYYGRQNWETI